ncbi:AtpZ/AtpI family protein [Emcibacter sp.]|uniref:AtpZ/AtpI family protein n=1 Tax=Emcibacter sp. TaxID=1979954 RepID=UPI002AA91508|nr:AtpZ/AtpI family protein [Emcibacter sp.]
MSDDEQQSENRHQSLDDFSARLQAARKAQEVKESDGPAKANAYGSAVRLVSELVAGLVMGLLLGLFLDNWLGTGPWLLIVFLFLGVGAGIMNVLRAARKMQIDMQKGAGHESEKTD